MHTHIHTHRTSKRGKKRERENKMYKYLFLLLENVIFGFCIFPQVMYLISRLIVTQNQNPNQTSCIRLKFTPREVRKYVIQFRIEFKNMGFGVETIRCMFHFIFHEVFKYSKLFNLHKSQLHDAYNGHNDTSQFSYKDKSHDYIISTVSFIESIFNNYYLFNLRRKEKQKISLEVIWPLN